MSWEPIIAPFIEEPRIGFSVSLALFSAWLIGFARSGLGAGGFVVSPLMVLALGAKDGLAVVAVLLIPAGLVGCWQHRKNVSMAILSPLVLGTLVGTGIGSFVLWALIHSGEEAAVEVHMEYVVAGLSLLYVALMMFHSRIAHWRGGGGPPQKTGIAMTGGLVGLSQTVANSGTPLATLYFVRHGLAKDQFVAAQNFLALSQNLIKLLPFYVLGILHLGNAGTALLLFPLSVLGSWCGKKFESASSERSFFILYTVLLIVGLVASILLLWGRNKFLSLL